MAENNILSNAEARRQNATRLKEARNLKYSYNDFVKKYQEQALEARKTETIAELQRRQDAKNRENAGFFVRALSTVGDLTANVITGALKGLEGIYDLGAGIVGAVGGIFSQDFQNQVKNHIAYDIVGENIGNPLQELTKYSYTNDGWLGQTIENVASGVGQMLPAVAVNLIPGAGQAASLAMFGAMAAGNSTEEAFKEEGTNYYAGMGYGVASGLVEMATEKMFGGATKNILGSGYLDNLTKNVAKSGIARVAKEALEEGAEEAVSELVNPLLRNIYQKKGFFEDFLTTEHLKNIGESALVGAATSVVYGETLGRINRSAVNIQEDIKDLDGIAKKEENLWANNKLDEASSEKISTLRKNIYQNISKELTSVKPEARTKLISQIERYGIKGVFDTNGKVITQTQTDTQETSKKALASYNKQAYSPELYGKETFLVFSPTTSTLTEEQIQARKTFNILNKGQNKSNFVITNQSLGTDSNGKTIQSAFVDGTLYISQKANATQALTEYEMTHSLEGTKAYNKYADYILKEISSNEVLKQKYGDINALYENVANSYREKLLKQEIKKGNNKLSRETVGDIDNIAMRETITEMVARFTSENIFTNQDQIMKLAEQEPSVIKKIASWVNSKIKAFDSGTAEQKAVAQFLAKASKLYNKALQESFGASKIDTSIRDVYNKEKGEVNDVRDNDSNKGEKWIKSKDSSKQARGVQEESKESGQEGNSKDKRVVARKLQTEKRTVRTVEIKQIDHKDWSDFEKKLANKTKDELGINLEFYDGSALPPNISQEDATNFDGFMDSNTNTMYLRSDSTLAEAEITEASKHEGVHHIRAVAPEAYKKVENAIINNIDIRDFAELVDVYSENYSSVYGENIDKIYEEIVADLVSQRIQATFSDIDSVNTAIDEMYKIFNSKTDSKDIKSGDLKYSQELSLDSEGSPLSNAQASYFKDSKVRDENGNLLVVYHGTQSEFTVFDNSKSLKSIIEGGLYFTKNHKVAEAYATSKAENNSVEQGKSIKAYLNITGYLDLTNNSSKYINDVIEHIPQEQQDLAKAKGINLSDGDFSFINLANAVYKKNGGYKNACDVIFGWGFDGVKQDNETFVAFESNQIKNIDNLNPTISEDIRYVINKNDDIKDLVVVHNTSETKLLQSIKLGGLAVPSIAITKDSTGHENFGEISLIFKKDTIDPSNPDNKVFSSDVYSKRFPKVINKLSSKTVKDLENKFSESAKEIGTSVSNLSGYIEEDSIVNIAEKLANLDYIRYQYLKDNNVNIEPVKVIYEEKHELNRNIYNMLIEKYPDAVENAYGTIDEDIFTNQITPDITKLYREYYLKESENTSREWIKKNYLEKANDTLGYFTLTKYLEDAKAYKRKKGNLVVDESATSAEIQKLTNGNRENIIKYVVDILDNYNEGAYFRNDKDLFNKYGDRRSFNQIYDEVSLDNLLNYMSGEVRDTEGFNYGVGNIRSLLSNQFDSIKEIKKYKDKILPAEKMEELKKSSSEVFDALCEKIHDDYSTAAEMLRDIAKTSISEYNINYVFKDYSRPMPTKETVGEIQEFMNALKDYPTNYFEAKPQRVVDFGEVAEVIAPTNVDDRIIDYFNKKGIKVELYSETTNKRSDLIKSLPEDIKFAMSKGLIKKDIAKGSKTKVYNKSEAEVAINNILGLINVNDNFYANLSGTNKAQAIDKLWIALNTKDEGFRSSTALEIADYIIDNSVMESMLEDYDLEGSTRVLDYLKGFLRKFDLSDIKGEIYNKYDKNTNIFAVWGKRNGDKGRGVDDAAMEIEGDGIIQFKHNNPADQFFEIVDAYNNAKESLKKARKQYLKELASDDDISQLRQDIAREVLLSYDKFGTKTRFAETIEKYQNKIGTLKEQLKDTKARNKAINNLFDTVDRVSALEKYKAADVELAPEVAGLIHKLKKIKTWRGNLAKNIRDIMSDYSQEVNGKKLYELISGDIEGIENPTKQFIEEIARNRGELTTAELQQLDLILRNFIHNVKNYNRVFFEGKNQVESEIAEQAIKETQEAIKVKDEGFIGALSKYSRWLQAPVWRFERLSSYRKNGVMTRVFEELKNGETRKSRFTMETKEHFAKFMQENKKELRNWKNQTFDINGVKMSKGQIISLYMLSQREQARSHLFGIGDSGTIRITNENEAKKGSFRAALNKGEDVQISKSTIDTIENMLTDTDKQFIKLAHEFFDGLARNAKEEVDMSLFGISNVGEDNYIPIRVADDQIYKEVGNESLSFSNLFNVYNPSFNKDVKQNANNKIVVENIVDIINRHSNQMACYYGYAIPIKSFNKIFNKKLEDGSTLRKEINKVDSDFEKYVGKLFADMQGNIKERSGLDKVISKVRGWGAKAALGLNLKVLANQFVSLPASAAIGVKYKNIMKGFGMSIARKTDYEKLTQYSPMLYDRFSEGSNIDVGLLKQGEGVLGKVDALTELTTAPIGKLDKFVCGAVWNACLEQTKNSSKYENYSDEHYKAAARLTENAVIKTQANYKSLYRPAVLREQSSFLQLATMFMSEPLQQFSLLASSIDKIRVARLQLKSASVENRAEYESLYKTAKVEATRAMAAITIDTILLTLIAQAFKWLKGQDDDENKLNAVLSDFAGNYIGMLPFVRDIATYLSGYDITNMAYTGLTNVAMGIQDSAEIFSLLVSGKAYDESQLNGKIRKTLVGICQTFGIPLRNLETYSKGIIEKFSPESVYKYDKFFYDGTTSSYTQELKAALEAGDDDMADTIIDLYLSEEKISVKDKKLRDELKILYGQGYSVFPRTVGKTLTFNGEKITLTQSQRKRFREVYSQSNEILKTITNSAEYRLASTEIKAKTIESVYDYYYDLAMEDLTGELVVSDKNKLFYTVFNIEDILIILNQAKALESDKDKEGKTISGSRKKKVQSFIAKQKLSAAEKYILMGFMGYTNKVGLQKVKTYIQRLKLTKAEKQLLLKYAGYSE